jgi:aspartyl protease family protein
MLAWAVRTIFLWSVVGVACVVAWSNRAIILPREAPVVAAQQQAVHAAPTPKRPVDNTLNFRTDNRGHVMLEAAVNGAPVRFMVDTGASYVTLTPEDASAAGLGSGDLHFTGSVATANGSVRVAPVKLRELRLDQLVMEDVDAVVVDSPMSVSLLGMSFLKRLNGYEMRDGTMIMSW